MAFTGSINIEASQSHIFQKHWIVRVAGCSSLRFNEIDAPCCFSLEVPHASHALFLPSSSILWWTSPNECRHHLSAPGVRISRKRERSAHIA